jgi:hypothetical protein
MTEIKMMQPYVLKVIPSGMDIRPLTTPELRAHLVELGIDSHLADQKISGIWMLGARARRAV